uniref:AlNc14C46G3738 protein n=1 Tax=Albugo laibachii Nc14 TaxID=890382 RepID=F0WAL4_9STRA|nr:AlNc14C46G3738 [Albugo laibachii Nc14]|eukprot:CCA18185.1 AlNc14C46G3738 [Albugo laibachii Nc14]
MYQKYNVHTRILFVEEQNSPILSAMLTIIILVIDCRYQQERSQAMDKSRRERKEGISKTLLDYDKQH